MAFGGGLRLDGKRNRGAGTGCGAAVSAQRVAIRHILLVEDPEGLFTFLVSPGARMIAAEWPAKDGRFPTF